MQTLIFDLETDGLIPDMTRIWSAGICDPETGIIQVFCDEDSNLPDLAEGISLLKSADRVVAHNLIGFDYWALEKLYPGTLKVEQLWDSIVVAALLEPEKRSHAIAAYGKEFGAPKGDFKNFKCEPEEGKTFEDILNEMNDYMVRDVEINVRIYNKLNALINKGDVDWSHSIDTEMKVQWCLALQEQHGFRLDLDKANQLDGILREESILLERQLQDIFPPEFVPNKGTWDYSERRWVGVEITTPKVNRKPQGIIKDVPHTKLVVEMFNPGSRQQIVRRLSAKYTDWKPTVFTPTGIPQIDEGVLTNMSYPEAEPLKRYFRVNKQLSQLSEGKNAWLKLEQNGYVKGRVKSVGCRTHRMSHFAPNMAQVDAKDKRMREVWVADEGHKLVGCDAAALELRMLAHYLAIWDNGDYAKAVIEGTQELGTDVHTRTKDIAGLYSRNSAKTLTYAFLYGAGNEKLSSIMIDDAKAANETPPKGVGYKLGKATRTKLETGINGLGKLIQVCQARDKTQSWLKGLDGRKVQTSGQHSALNTLLQSAGAIVMKQALVELHFNLGPKLGLVDEQFKPVGWHYVANVHDEFQLTAQPEVAEKLGQAARQAIVNAGVTLNLRCDLDGEYMIGDSWSETH